MPNAGTRHHLAPRHHLACPKARTQKPLNSQKTQKQTVNGFFSGFSAAFSEFSGFCVLLLDMQDHALVPNDNHDR